MSYILGPKRLAIPVNERDYALGPPDAPVTLVEYGDFECPFCGLAYRDLKEIRAQLGDRMRLIYRHFPRPEHPHARHAAEAAECAGVQGSDRFWAMHDVLFEHQQALEDHHLIEYAGTIGLDVERFNREFSQHTLLRDVQDDLESGVQSGVHGTPAFFINGERYQGLTHADDLFRHLVRQLGDDVGPGSPLDRVDDVSTDSLPASDSPGWIAVRT
jgi:protein-disulfide isomerase